jgi:hypothetical protein
METYKEDLEKARRIIRDYTEPICKKAMDSELLLL